MVGYNLTLMQNAGMVGVLQATNTYAGGVLGIIILVVFGIILFSVLSFATPTSDVKNAFAGTLFVMILISFGLLALSLLTTLQFFILIILFIGSLLFVVSIGGN